MIGSRLFLKQEFTSWDEWLEISENYLKEKGYKRYNDSFKTADFIYWRTFKDGDKKLYTIGILFYDFRKHGNDRIGIQYECLLSQSDRIDLSVSKNIVLQEFESMSEEFYKVMRNFYKDEE